MWPNTNNKNTDLKHFECVFFFNDRTVFAMSKGQIRSAEGGVASNFAEEPQVPEPQNPEMH